MSPAQYSLTGAESWLETLFMSYLYLLVVVELAVVDGGRVVDPVVRGTDVNGSVVGGSVVGGSVVCGSVVGGSVVGSEVVAALSGTKKRNKLH